MSDYQRKDRYPGTKTHGPTHLSESRRSRIHSRAANVECPAPRPPYVLWTGCSFESEVNRVSPADKASCVRPAMLFTPIFFIIVLR